MATSDYVANGGERLSMIAKEKIYHLHGNLERSWRIALEIYDPMKTFLGSDDITVFKEYLNKKSPGCWFICVNSFMNIVC